MTISVWGSENSLDLQNIELPDARYDWIYSSHVLNHVPDHAAALREMQRVVGANGVVLLSVGGTVSNYASTPSNAVLGPDRQFHLYGTEFADDVREMLPDVAVLELVTVDPCTGTLDSVYLTSRNVTQLREMALRAVPDNIHARVFPATTSERDAQRS